MFTDPAVLIDETLDRLDLLSTLFSDEVDERIRHAGDNEPTVILCREVGNKIDDLIPALRAAKATQASIQRRGVCMTCDD